MAFVHLHTHSEYSLLDGANRIPELLDRVQALGMESLAITDHGNLHGAWQFYAEARARKLWPIGFLEGFYRRPRIDREVLERYSGGLIGLAACLSGEIALYLRQGNYEAAKASAQYFAGVFGADGFW